MNYHRDDDYLANEELFKNIFLKRVILISKFIKSGKVLEVGSSTGVMLNLFKGRGWDTLGIEPSGSAKEAKKKGLKILNTKFEEADLPDEYFDLVVLNHTLEHMDKPDEVLIKICRILKPGGYVYVDVPNFGSLASKLLGKKWPYLLPEEHKSQFTRKSLAILLERADFKIVHWESRSGVFEYANPLLELHRKRFMIDLALLPYSFIATFFNVGDSMSFIAQKI